MCQAWRSPTAVGWFPLAGTPPARSSVTASATRVPGSLERDDRRAASHHAEGDRVPVVDTPELIGAARGQRGQLAREVAGAVGQDHRLRQHVAAVVDELRGARTGRALGGARRARRCCPDSRSRCRRRSTRARRTRWRRPMPPPPPIASDAAREHGARSEPGAEGGRVAARADSWITASSRSQTPGGGGPPVCARNDALCCRPLTSRARVGIAGEILVDLRGARRRRRRRWRTRPGDPGSPRGSIGDP